MSTYSNALLSYASSTGTSTFETEEYDYTKDISGNHRLSYTVLSALAGSYTATLELKPDGGSYTSYSDLTVRETARYMKGKVTATGSSNVARVVIPSIFGQVTTVPHTESGEDTSSSTAAKTITLDNDYAQVQQITITPQGTTSAHGVVDNIDLSAGTFDVYIFNSSGSQISRDFYWTFVGV